MEKKKMKEKKLLIGWSFGSKHGQSNGVMERERDRAEELGDAAGNTADIELFLCACKHVNNTQKE